MKSNIELQEELNMIDQLISIYSTIDMVRVSELVNNKIALESIMLDIMTKENEVFLNKIRKSA